MEAEYNLREYKLKNDIVCEVRDIDVSDAEAFLEYLKIMINETEFLLTSYEELLSLEDYKKILPDISKPDINKNTNIVRRIALINNEIVGTYNVQPVGNKGKIQHRATFGVTVKKQHWGMGLGNILVREIIENSKKIGYEQIELEVFSNNERAIKLYEKYGFEKWGEFQNAFKLKDGSYRNSTIMGKFLK